MDHLTNSGQPPPRMEAEDSDLEVDSLEQLSSSEDLPDDGKQTNRPVDTGDMVDLGDDYKVSKKILLNAASYVQKKTYQFYGEVSFLLPFDEKEEIMTSDQYVPLTFLRAVGFQRNQAKEILEDPIIFTNIYIVLKEARLWTQSLEHAEATLLYQAADKLKRGKRAAEYMAMVTDAVISGNIPSFDELTAFVKFVDKIEEGKCSWDEIIPLSSKKEIKNIPYMLHQYEVEKVFMDILKVVKHLKALDDKMMENVKDNNVSERLSFSEDHNMHSSSSDEGSEKSEKNTTLTDAFLFEARLLKARRDITDKEISKQCCIFANYYDPSMYKYIPLLALMIARGYFTNYIEIEAVIDYLRPICGMRPVKLIELLDIICNVSNWEMTGHNETFQDILLSHKCTYNDKDVSNEVGLQPPSGQGSEEIGTSELSKEVDKSILSEEVENSILSREVEHSIVSKELKKIKLSEDVEKCIPSKEVEKSIPSEEVEKSIPSEEVEKSIPSEEVEKSIPSEEVEKSIPSEVVEKSIPSEQGEKYITSEQGEKSIPSEQGEKSLSEGIEKSILSDKVEKSELSGEDKL